MKLKNLITIGAVAGLLVSLSPIGLIAPKVLATEVSSAAAKTNNNQEFRYDFEKELGYATVNVPKTAIKGEAFLAGLMYDWALPDTINVLHVIMTLDDTSDAVLTGVEGMIDTDYRLSDDGKRLSILMDEAEVKKGVYGIVQSDSEETITLHVNMEYVNIDAENKSVENIVNQDLSITVIDGKVLEDAKAAAKDTISNLPNLSATEKSDYIAEVEKSSSVEMVNDVVNNAKEKDAENLAIAKQNGKETINQLPDLPEQDKNNFIDRVNHATTIQEVNAIVEEAKAFKIYKFNDFIIITPDTPERVFVNQNGTPRATTMDMTFEWLVSDVSNMLDLTFVIPEGNDSTFTGVKELDTDHYTISEDGKTLRVIVDEELEGLSLELAMMGEGEFTIQTHAVYGNETLTKEMIQDSTLSTVIKSVLKGDLNNDGKVSVVDMALIKSYINSGVIPANIDKELFEFAADINNDGRITIVDQALLKVLVGKQ